MAGQMSTGWVAAKMTVVSRSSPIPVAILPMKLAVAGATHEGVHVLAQGDMLQGRGLGPEKLGPHLLPGQGLKGQRPHKLPGRRGHHHLDPCPQGDQPPGQLRRLIRGDAARHPQENFFYR